MISKIMIKKLKIKILYFIFLCFIVFDATSQEIKVSPLKVGKKTENVFASDFFENRIYFCSDRKIKTKVKTLNENNSNFLSIYSVIYNFENGKLTDEVMLDSNVNSILNEGPIDFNNESKMGYFSSNVPNNESEELILGLYQTLYSNDGTFKKRIRIFEGFEGVNMAHPTISENGKVLVFSSDLKGKVLPSNLYWSFFQDGKWSEPQLIKGLNSDSTETLPHFHKNTLYFASNRARGIGGLDVYQSKFIDQRFSEPQLLPSPINSEFDDFLFIPITETQGIFSSNRLNYTDRIFSYQYELPEPLEFIEAEVYFCYELKDEVFLDTNRYEYHWDMGDQTICNSPKVHHCYADTGVYDVSCYVLTKRDGDIDSNSMTCRIEIKMETPFIDINKEESSYFVNKQFSKFDFDQFYWLVDGAISFEDKIPMKGVREIKLVVWSEKSTKNVLGIQKKVTLR